MKKVAFAPRGDQKIKKFLTGGLAGGAAIGTSIALLNYLNDLYKETQAGNSQDDNTLYVDLPAEEEDPRLGKQATVSGGVALTGGLLALLGSSAAVRNIYQEIKKKELQKQLDQAQVAYSGKVLEEADSEKIAAAGGAPMAGGDWLTSLPISMLLLTSLASGALTYKGLNKHFPATKKPQSLEPKRVVVRRKTSQPGFYEEENDEETEKPASYDELATDQERADDALEFVIKLAMHNPAPHSDLKNLVYGVAAGRHNELCNARLDCGMDTVLSLVKNASHLKLSAERVDLAISRCVKSAYLRPTIELMAYAEFNDMAPTFVKAASDMTEEAQDALIKIASALGVAVRREFWLGRYDKCFEVSKEAGIGSDILEGLMDGSLEDDEALSHDEDGAGDVPLTMETESEVSQSQRPEDQNSEDKKQVRADNEEESDSEDQIDELMSNMSGGTGA